MKQAALFQKSLPRKPYCSDDLSRGGLRIRTVQHAIKRHYIQPNHPNSKLWLVFDIDRSTAVDEITDDLNLPAPHFFVQNPANQHAHVYYGLETAVHLNRSSSDKPIRFAAAVDCALTERMQADAQYCGLIAKNPLHEHWRTYTINSESYTLGDLSEYLDLSQYGDRRRLMPDTGLGRNVNLFTRLRNWSYKSIRQEGWPSFDQWQKMCWAKAFEYNRTETPLPDCEVQGIAKSVAKWTHKQFTAQGFSEIQAHRGSLKGKATRDAKLQFVIDLKEQGHSQRAIAEKVQEPRTTVQTWLKEYAL